MSPVRWWAIPLVLLVVVLPAARHGSPVNAVTACLAGSGLSLFWWRTRPRPVVLAGGALWLAAAALAEHGYFPDLAFVLLPLLSTVAALAFPVGAAGAGLACYLVVLFALLHFTSGETNPVPLLIFGVPGFLAAAVLRLRRETAEQLTQRTRELEEERELFADLAIRHERARIAAELHDIIGHAISVMIIQAAAGQRLADHDPARTRQAFEAIAESARQGRHDLQRLVDLLGSTEQNGPDLSLIDEVVTRAARTGLDVSCQFEGAREDVAAPVAHLAFRVVQEGLTNALRYAPGSAVRVTLSGSASGFTVRVENSPAGTVPVPGFAGTGHGLTGLRERIQRAGGRLTAGPTASGGWLVRASLPRSGRDADPVAP
ncbi:sensor histidine kinase [Actinoplanes sp. NPDC051343]|uniref:sensor histidine kinase n=1 Tax=Actinoplanes sp. NPDC051343 TaxID=3363906 RepID=UPI0037A76C86